MYVHKPWKTFFAPTIIKYEKPTVNDYLYDVPTVWLDKTTDICYMLVDNTMGAAQWVSRENSHGSDSVWILYGDNACYLAGKVGIGTNEPISLLTVAGTVGAGANGSEFVVSIDGDVTCGLVNGQTISGSASFTGTVSAENGFQVAGAATSGNVLRGNGTVFIPSTLSKNDVGLGNVDNTSDANKPISIATDAALDLKADLVDGKVPISQLPSSATLALGETSDTAYRGDRGKIAYNHSQLTDGNPHSVTKSDLSLENVDNTSDLNKPLSTATIQALLTKADLVTGKVPREQLPSMTYEIVSYPSGINFPLPGNSYTYYVALDTQYVYLWGGDGVGYVMITGSLTIADNSVTMAKLANIANNTVIGNVSGAEGDPKALSASELRSMLGSVGVTTDSAWAASGDLLVGTGNDTASILSIGSNGKVLTSNGTTVSWQTPATGGGTITNVTGTLPIISSGGTTPAISIRASSVDYSGYMSAAQATKLAGIATGANNYTHPTGDGNLHVPATSGITQGYALINNSPGNAPTWGVPVTHPAVTVSSTSSITLSRTDQLISADVLPGGVDHDALLNFVANEHINHANVKVIGGTGITVNGVTGGSGASIATSLTIACSVVGYSAATAIADLISDAVPVDGITDKAPTVNAVFDALGLKANLAGPTFTGTVNVTNLTASGTDNGIIIANKVKISNIADKRIPYNTTADGLADSSLRYNVTRNSLAIGTDAPTTTPCAWLTIAASGTTGAHLRLVGSTVDVSGPNVGDLWFNSSTPALWFQKDSSTKVNLLTISGSSQWITSGSNIYFGTVSTGAVGIGTSSPQSKLHVYGTNSSQLITGLFENTSTTGYSDLRVKSGTTIFSFGACSQSYSGEFAGGAWLWNYGGGKLSFGTSPTSGGTCVERMAIANNGVISGVIPDGKFHWFSKTQSASIANSTSVYTQAENQYPFIAGLCVATTHTTTDVSGAANNISWYPSYMSKVSIPSGAGCDIFADCTTNIGDAAQGGNSNVGLVHKVAMSGSAGDLAAVWHLVEVSGQTASERAETAALSYYHHFNTSGKGYSSILEGQQIFDNIAYGNGVMTLGSRGGFGWHHVVNVHSNCAAYIPQYSFISVTTNGAAAYNTWSGANFLSVAGKWNYLLGCPGLFGTLTINTCGLDLYTNISYGDYVPAIRMGSETFIDLYGEVPNLCTIRSYTNVEQSIYGAFTVTIPSNGSGANALTIADTSTYLRIAGTGYFLRVENGFVKVVS